MFNKHVMNCGVTLTNYTNECSACSIDKKIIVINN